jgi:hypothetical protein
MLCSSKQNKQQAHERDYSYKNNATASFLHAELLNYENSLSTARNTQEILQSFQTKQMLILSETLLIKTNQRDPLSSSTALGLLFFLSPTF